MSVKIRCQCCDTELEPDENACIHCKENACDPETHEIEALYEIGSIKRCPYCNCPNKICTSSADIEIAVNLACEDGRECACKIDHQPWVNRFYG